MATAISRDEALRSRARAWLEVDPDPETRAAALALLEADDPAALREHFGARLAFGTAGMRGALGPGPNRMNRALVRRVSAGLADYLCAQSVDLDADRRRGVVVGYDGRVGSRAFAEDTAGVLAARGFVAHLSPTLCSTPVLAFAVHHLGAVAGVMVTASHNPPGDNGYKVYWRNAAQIIPPHDAGIAAAIDQVESAEGTPEALSLEAALAAGRLQTLPDAVEAAWRSAVLAQRVHPAPGARVRFVYTAMHGVGYAPLGRLLAAAGHDDLHPVVEQVEPDGRFPTVAFPNPEEPGALDLAYARARAVDADVVIANDPDADRLAVAIPDRAGQWRALTGNQVGVLLACDLLAHGPQDTHRLVATTIVSSVLLARIAQTLGVGYAETLTGFKWIANRALAHEADGGRFVMGYEEALGYSVGPVVRDKDGLSAALILLDLVAFEKARGRTLNDTLDDLARRFGVSVTAQHSVVLPGTEGAAQIAALMSRLRATPLGSLGGVEITHTRDLARPESPALPTADVLTYDLADGSRILARPSGTEPKIKFYFEVLETTAEGEALETARHRADLRLETLRTAFLEHLHGGSHT
ncbi:MAG: phospho-sugar mutase [Bradymonadia bacterium]